MSQRVTINLVRLYNLSTAQSDPYRELVTVSIEGQQPFDIDVDIDTIPSGEDIIVDDDRTIRLNDQLTEDLFGYLNRQGIPSQSISPVNVYVNEDWIRGYEFNHLDNDFHLNYRLFQSIDEFNSESRWRQLLSQLRADIKSINNNDMVARYWGLIITNNAIRYYGTIHDKNENYNLTDRIIQSIDYIGSRDLGAHYYLANRAVISRVVAYLLN